jgi:uncharacterized protein
MRKFVLFFKSLLKQEYCAHKFALSCCIGAYIAFSPFIGLHTAMVFLFSWLFTLNAAIIFAVSFFINNPWTMVPVYGIGYIVGDWLLTWFGIANMADNTTWSIALPKIYNYCSSNSLLAFLVGGNLLGLGIGGILYPIMRYIFNCYNTVKS